MTRASIEKSAPHAAWDGRGLVLPDGNIGVLKQAYRSHQLEMVRRFMALGESLPPDRRSAHRAAVSAVKDALGRDRASCLAAFAAPAVATPLQCLSLRADLPRLAAAIDARAEEVVPHLLLELAARGLLEDGPGLDWPFAARALDDSFLGVLFRPASGARGFRFTAGGLEALQGGAAGERVPLVPGLALKESAGGFAIRKSGLPVAGTTRLALIDANPIADVEAHPDKTGNALDLGGQPAERWVAALETSFDLLRAHWPALVEEMALVLRQIVPVGYSDQKHLSASYREATGTLYMTLHPNVLVMTEALIHEFQHNKLSLGDRTAPLLNNAFFPLFRSPVRPDPRPLWGILMAVHAFLPVAAFYRRMRQAREPLALSPDAAKRLTEIDLKNREGMDVLRANADWTPAGRAMMAELEELDELHMAELKAQGSPLLPSEAHED